jgi:hypothetical protein
MTTAIIYKDKRTNKLFVMNDMITQGEKVCMAPMDKSDDKVVSPSTLKRWYTKWEEVPYIVEVKAFSGMKIGLFKATKGQDGNLEVWTKADKLLVFDPKTDKQINAKNPKFANKIGMTYGWLY